MNARTRLLATVSLCALATTLAATLSIRTVAAGTASANLDQCANGPTNSPVRCSGSAWQNGNTTSNNSHWYEGDSIAYRSRFSGLAIGTTHYVTIQWDTTKSGKHAVDYLTSYDRTESVGNNPCSGVAGCGGSPSTGSIPPDTHTGLSLNPLYPSPDDGRWNQVFTMFNGTIKSVMLKDPSLSNPELPYNVTGAYDPVNGYVGDTSTTVTSTFVSDLTTPVRARGGQIAHRHGW